MAQIFFYLQSTQPGSPAMPISALGLRLGRAPDCAVVLTDDAASWTHALVRETDGKIVVTDTHSTNGVYIDNRRIPSDLPYPWQPGETLQIGATTFALMQQGQPTATPEPGVLSTGTRPSSGGLALPLLIGGLVIVLIFIIMSVMTGNSASQPDANVTLPPTIAPTNTALPPTDTARPPTRITPSLTATSDAHQPIGRTPTPGSRSASLSSTPSANSSLNNSLASSVESVLKHLQGLGGAMDRLYHGSSAEGCPPLLADFYGVTQAPTYGMNGQPANVQNAYNAYRSAISLIAEQVAPLQQICESGGGTVSKLVMDTGRTAINDANDLLNSAFKSLGR